MTIALATRAPYAVRPTKLSQDFAASLLRTELVNELHQVHWRLSYVRTEEGAFGGVLGFLGVPWVSAVIVATPVGAALLYLRICRQGVACQTPEPPTWFGKS